MVNRESLEIRRRKGLRQLKECWWYKPEDITPGAVGKAGTTPVRCSCWMCGNPRRHWGHRTWKEIRAFQSEDWPGGNADD